VSLKASNQTGSIAKGLPYRKDTNYLGPIEKEAEIRKGAFFEDFPS